MKRVVMTALMLCAPCVVHAQKTSAPVRGSARAPATVRGSASQGSEAQQRASLWSAVRNVQQLEVQANTALTGKQTAATVDRARPLVERKDRAMRALRSKLDSVVFRTTWGPVELDALRKAYPETMMFVEYEAMLAEKDGRLNEALGMYDKLLTIDPQDIGTQQHEGIVLEHLGRPDEARLSYARILEMEPENTDAFMSLVRLQTVSRTLPELLDRIQRLQLRFPKSRVLAEHNIEMLHRLGRTADAEAAARALKEHGK